MFLSGIKKKNKLSGVEGNGVNCRRVELSGLEWSGVDPMLASFFWLQCAKHFVLECEYIKSNVHCPLSKSLRTVDSGPALHYTWHHFTTYPCPSVHCTAFNCTELYKITLQCIVPYWSALQSPSLHYTILECTALQ